MRAFSYAWSLPVTWQRWQSHHSIRHSRKPHVARKIHGSMCCRTGVIADRSFTLREYGFSTFLLTWPWPSYTNKTAVIANSHVLADSLLGFSLPHFHLFSHMPVHRLFINNFIFYIAWPWPWLDNIYTRTWPVFPRVVQDERKQTCYVKAFESYRLAGIQTDSQTPSKS